ncbi:hypothetical protein HYPSUDRAFT_36452 [Hypholoma sublateritium FD-334 SS-4]|uniref:Peptidase A1 domain-containing protein n=1 Tax=Hypholoma sublateritium (strain FD-334 SS-4) TaxID=945553 RepID=A0A0D2MQF5_HYPSF|nr:hypothetical protein HYPSUDRAFT_36452 [Hypholoma sublateritium FD-334 SS-4]
MGPLILALSLLSLADVLVIGDPIHVPVRRLHTGQKSDLNEIAHRVRVKYGFPEILPSGRRRRASSASIPTVDQDVDSSYFASVTVGTPPQNLGVILDTGSSDLWFAGTSCRGCSGQIPVFDPSASSSFQGGTTGTSNAPGSTALGSPIEIQYGSGTVSGSIAEDTVTMGGFTVQNQKIVNVDNIDGNILVADPQGASGLMGLAFTSLAQTEATPFWLALANSNQFSSPEIAFWLARSTNPEAQDVAGGVFTLGGTNSSLFTGDIEFLNIPTNPLQFWALPLTTVQVNGATVKIQSANMPAAIDTGTSLIAGPTEDVAAIWAAVPGSGPSPSNQGFFNFPCSTPVSVSISFGGKTWPISELDIVFTTEPEDNSKCIGSIFGVTIPPNSGTPSWIFGDTFLKNVYSVFRSNPPSVGFAQLSSITGSGAGSSVPSATLAPTTSISPPITGLPQPTVSGVTGSNGNGGSTVIASSSTATTTGAGQVISSAESIKASILLILASAVLTIANL